MNSNRLLVIDDEEDIRYFIRDVAEDYGFDVAVAKDFEEFRSRYQSVAPSLIVLDLKMPRVDGIELLRYLASEQCKAQILLTSGVDHRILNTTRQLGVARGLNMIGILTKPIVLADLEAMLSSSARS